MSSATKVAFLGPEGTYTHQAVLQQFPNAECIPQTSIASCFEAVNLGSVDFAVVPFENSTNGQVVYTYDLIRDWFGKGCQFKIVAEQFVAIHHNFITKAADFNSIKTVFSHPQVWGQVGKFLSTLPVNVRREDVSLTSRAAEMVSNDKSNTTAAISSEMAAKLFDIPIMYGSVEDNKNNTTRFLVLGYEEPPKGEMEEKESGVAELKESYITSLLFTLNHNDPGALCAALNVLSLHGVNMTSINSRPSHLKQWQYVFFVEVHGNLEKEENVKKGIEELGTVCELTVLGLFKRNWRYNGKTEEKK